MLKARMTRTQQLAPQDEKVGSLPSFITALLPSLVTAAGEKASYKFVEFFAEYMNSENMRKTYTRAAHRFLGWCDERGFELDRIPPVAVAGYIRQLEAELPPASVEVHLAAIRMLFDWFMVERIISHNPVSFHHRFCQNRFRIE